MYIKDRLLAGAHTHKSASKSRTCMHDCLLWMSRKSHMWPLWQKHCGHLSKSTLFHPNHRSSGPEPHHKPYMPEWLLVLTNMDSDFHCLHDSFSLYLSNFSPAICYLLSRIPLIQTLWMYHGTNHKRLHNKIQPHIRITMGNG